MSLLDVLRNAVAVADTVTKDIQATVMYTRSLGTDHQGDPIPPGDAVPLRAIVDWKRANVRTMSGELSVSRVSIMLLDIAAVVAATGGEGIGDDDIFILPDGTTGPILDMSGFIDAQTGHPIATEVLLG